MRFKVGDKVKIIKNVDGSEYDEYIGQIGEVTKVHGTYYSVLFKDSMECGWVEEEVSGSRGRPCKPKPVRFIVVYEEEDGDPVKEFVSKTGLNKWLREANEDENIVFDSIKVYSVDGEYDVLTSFHLKKRE